jgi:hypothetical protein
MNGPIAPPLAVTPHPERALEPLPFTAPGSFDPALEGFLQDATHQLCRWLGSAEARPPLPGLSLLPPSEACWA